MSEFILIKWISCDLFCPIIVWHNAWVNMVYDRIKFLNCAIHTKLEARFGFLACSRHATMTEQLYGPHLTRIWDLENLSSASCWDPGPMDPRSVPWDQNFWLKNFLISSSNDVILCILGICYAKNAQNHEKLSIFA